MDWFEGSIISGDPIKLDGLSSLYPEMEIVETSNQNNVLKFRCRITNRTNVIKSDIEKRIDEYTVMKNYDIYQLTIRGSS